MVLTQFMAYSVCAGLNWVWFGFFWFCFLVGFSLGGGSWGEVNFLVWVFFANRRRIILEQMVNSN